MKRLLRWLRPPRRFPPTREGWWFLAATLLIGAAAINGGINLLFLIFGMMLSLILTSGVLSELCLRDLAVNRRVPSTVHAGTPFLMGIAVRNDKGKIPTFSLEVEDLLEGRPVERRCYYLKLPAGRVQETAYKHTLPKRGKHRFTGFRLSTRFPFGLIRKSRDVVSPADVLVYPALVPVPETLIKAGLADSGRRHKPTRARNGEFHGLREFRTSDDPRDIHWRTTARHGRPFVRESEEETGRTVLVVLDEYPADGEAPDPTPRAFEAAVSLAASVAVVMLKKGLHVGLKTTRTFIPPGVGPLQAPEILRTLALVQPGTGRGEETSGKRHMVPGGAAIIRVSPGATAPRFAVEKPVANRRTA